MTVPEFESGARATAGAVRWMLGFVRPHLGRGALVLGLSLAGSGLGLVQPFITKFLIDDGILGGDFALLVWLCLLMVAAGLASAALGGLNRWHYIALSGRVLFAMREHVYRHLQTLSPAFHARASGGDILARLDGDIGEIQRFAVDVPLSFVNAVIVLGGALAFMLWLSWPLALLAFVLLPAEIVFLRLMRPRVEARTRALRERASAVTAFFFDTLGAMKLVQASAAEEREARRLTALNADYLGDLLRLQMTNFVTATVPNLLVSVSTALVFAIGGYLVIRGSLTLGTLIAFSAYLARATGPVQSLMGLYVGFMRVRVSLGRVRELTGAAPAVTNPPAPRPIPADAAGRIELDDVRFRYPDPDAPPVLDGASATFEGGAAVAVRGASGIGKSTLIDLLQRHFDPEAGAIRLDGIDLRAYELGALRRRVAVVAQDAPLLPGTIAENIRYAAPGADDAALLRAARLAEVDAFASGMPQGYDTQVGARGMALSGGQRQRVAIARALLQDPLVLILDEATAAVDLAAEQRIVAAIHDLFAGRTRVIISHRAEALAGIDAHYELARGKLVRMEDGHDREAG